AHQAGVVVAISAGELERELVAGVERTAAGEIAAEQRVLSRADDVLVGGVVPAAPEHGALHGRDDVALEGAGTGEPVRLVEREVGELGSLPNMGDLGGTLHDAEAAHEVRRIFEPADAIERRVEPHAVARREAVSLVLDAKFLAGAAERAEDLAELR